MSVKHLFIICVYLEFSRMRNLINFSPFVSSAPKMPFNHGEHRWHALRHAIAAGPYESLPEEPYPTATTWNKVERPLQDYKGEDKIVLS